MTHGGRGSAADDVRWDMLWAMPNVMSRLADPGVRFRQAYVSNAG